MAGTLFVVATPLGNLEDITLRARRILQDVLWIACEDTRHSGRFLRGLGANASLLSYHAHNEASREAKILGILQNGEDVALIADAGTPCISDPGERLVRACRAAGLTVVPIPGPSAVITALSGSGLPSGRFHFEGFLPREDKHRRARLEALNSSETTFVLYESPKRIHKLLEELVEICGESRQVCVARELTKMHEEFLNATARELLDQISERNALKGEFTVIVEASEPKQEDADDVRVAALVQTLRNEGLSDRSIRGVIMETFELSRNAAYAYVLDLADGPADGPTDGLADGPADES
ncbi:MAG: 16S rRNA (cytidine(1402)-2'-O)-methyltransferase [Deltaproteobacteria bacterium CG17_big_fil_post_rev_8_21_14_2_50_63_7]|nr:MAG: 16S rRNA (cytidine(1402)-2'-O)-methyltransferase [Deltaproteobacteria bacterium CG17_big_fil_post_rev_8_21_14_2_50_63_7]